MYRTRQKNLQYVRTLRLHNIYFLWIVLDLKIRTIYARVNIFPIQSGQIHVSENFDCFCAHDHVEAAFKFLTKIVERIPF